MRPRSAVRPFRIRVLVVAALSGLPLGVARAQESPEPPRSAPTPEQRYLDWASPGFPAGEYAARRARLLEALPDGPGIVFVNSAHGLSHGETFRQADDFLYLTGLELPSSTLVIDTESGRSALFAPRRDFRFESATRPNDFPGRPLADDPQLASVSGISDVRPTSELDAALQAWERQGVPVYVNAGLRGR
ncbi:MAG: aminopeptidase P N-terminal domain-containing protein, partial [Gemmatimonadota bacterium]|nr:aminopeptidase P N-terminal domain-containing protein [Gemmatimonadota bacterium]